MIRLLVPILSIIVLTGCLPKTEYRLVCDSGFETPYYRLMYHENGIHTWRVAKGESRIRRRMLEGEICHVESRYVSKDRL